jgi:hypothetical protein
MCRQETGQAWEGLCSRGVLIREEGFLYQEFGPNFVEHFTRTSMSLPKLTQLL